MGRLSLALAVLIACGAAGCDGRTTVLVHVAAAPYDQLASLAIQVQRLSPAAGATSNRYSNARLPAAVVIILDDTAVTLRISVSAAAADGALLVGSIDVPSSPHHEVVAELNLMTDLDAGAADGALADGALADGGLVDGAADGAAGNLDAGTDAKCVGVVCDDFESGMIRPPWQVSAYLATATVDRTRPHGGAYSLHAHIDAADAGTDSAAWLKDTSSFPLLQTGLFLRAFVYIPAAFGTTAPLFYQLGNDNGIGQTLAIQPSGVLQLYQYNTNPDVSINSTAMPGFDQWLCIEWMMLGGESRVWVNDVELPELHLTTLRAIPYTFLQIGGYVYRAPMNDPAYDAWIDDVIVATQHIGCK